MHAFVARALILKRVLFFPQRSCILKGHQLLKKSHIFQNVFLQFKVTVRDDREGFLGWFAGGCHGVY